jgi:autotransporter-associated beta strand protein
MNAWQVLGGITFNPTGGATAYSLGASSNQIQLATTATTSAVSVGSLSTASQTINAGIELWSNTSFQNNMTGGQPLNINGNLSGAGNLAVDGAGTVILSGAGSYAGTTTIGSGSLAAVLRANADSALSTGTVIIGAGGNASTARLEIAGSHTLPNAIDFHTRNNSSVGIESVSGSNSLPNTISADNGGSILLIQADAGSTLTLSGATNGVSLQSATAGRTVTLQGSGNGIVAGKIQDGSGTIGLTKAGTGVWTLLGPERKRSADHRRHIHQLRRYRRSGRWQPGHAHRQERLEFEQRHAQLRRRHVLCRSRSSMR